jgi:large subunit ribosomal protein L18
VFRSGKHIYAQVVDDQAGHTLASASTLSKSVEVEGHGGNAGAAKLVGTAIAKAAIDAGVQQVVFDRNGYLYHGRVKALADAAREAGLEF